MRSNITKILIVVVGIILLGTAYLYQDKLMNFFNKQKSELRKNDPPKQDLTSGGSSININSSISSDDCKSPIEAPLVADGNIMGVVEVGASGFNAFAIKLNSQGQYETLYKEYNKSLALEGFATYDDVKTKLQDYLAKLFDRGVSSKNMHFVISSGALKHPNTKIISAGLKKMGYFVNEVTASEEGRYALLGLLPKDYYNNSMTVDIGSGNTKISYIQNGRVTSYETYGAKYVAKGATDAQVSAEIDGIMQKIPNQYKDNIFIIGGVPYELSTLTCTQPERYTLLKSPDDYQMTDVAKFNSGLKIYKYIYTNAQPKQVIFDKDTSFVIGFLLTLKR